MKYARITDKGECLSTLDRFPQIPWPEPRLRNIANKTEWGKFNFYPSNGLVAEVPYVINKDMSLGIDLDVYILKVTDNLYVPMTAKGIEFISKEEYLREKSHNNIGGMDERQQKINAFDDLFTMPKFDLNNHDEFSVDAHIYCNSTKYALSKNADNIRLQIDDMVENYKANQIHLYPLNEITSLMVEWTKQAVAGSGWSPNDIDGVCWWIGLYVKGYCKAIGNENKFDVIFKTVFTKYFRH